RPRGHCGGTARLHPPRVAVLPRRRTEAGISAGRRLNLITTQPARQTYVCRAGSVCAGPCSAYELEVARASQDREDGQRDQTVQNLTARDRLTTRLLGSVLTVRDTPEVSLMAVGLACSRFPLRADREAGSTGAAPPVRHGDVLLSQATRRAAAEYASRA